jgi:endonuclease III related protein
MSNKFLEICNILYKNYGSQGWWPVTNKGERLPKYSGGPKTYKQKLEVMFGTVLVQNTTWKNAQTAIIKLNEHDLIDIDKILNIELDKLAGTIKPSGYFNQKAKKLKLLCTFLKKFPINVLQDLESNITRKLLLDVKGIGPETADSILLYALNKPMFVIDAYTKRIFSRLGLVDKSIKYEELQELFHNSLEKDSKLFNKYHALLVEHAKRYCKAKPLCEECPLINDCKLSN